MPLKRVTKTAIILPKEDIMGSFESKKLALIRILEILRKYTDENHLLTQEQIIAILMRDYGIEIERKAVGRNVSLLKEAGYDVVSTAGGCYLADRLFENGELRLLIDGVMCSKHVPATHTIDLIKKLASLGNKYFNSSVKNIYSVRDRNKSDNKQLFLNVEICDEAIEKNKKVRFIYNKYGVDKKLHSTSTNVVSPYQMILHNQHYYLVAYSDKWQKMRHYRMDKITEISLLDERAVPLRTISGYENGIDYKHLSAGLPYMFTDEPQRIEFIAKESIIDQIIDWFGYDVKIVKNGDGEYKITMNASLNAMEFWAMQYLNYVEILSPTELRNRIKENINQANEKYGE